MEKLDFKKLDYEILKKAIEVGAPAQWKGKMRVVRFADEYNENGGPADGKWLYQVVGKTGKGSHQEFGRKYLEDMGEIENYFKVVGCERGLEIVAESALKCGMAKLYKDEYIKAFRAYKECKIRKLQEAIDEEVAVLCRSAGIEQE